MNRSTWTTFSGSFEFRADGPRRHRVFPGRRAKRGADFLLDPEDAFARAGVNPAAGPQILLTHGHYDHIGNVSLFPTSRIVIARREFDFWTGPHAEKPLFSALRREHRDRPSGCAEAAGRVTSVRHLLPSGTRNPDRRSRRPHTRAERRVRRHRRGDGASRLRCGPLLRGIRTRHGLHVGRRPGRMYDCFASIRKLVETGEVAHVVSGHDPAHP